MSNATLPMPRKTQRPETKPAEPLPDFFLRLPGEYRDLLRAMIEMTSRSMTVEAQIALERRAKSLGLQFTPNHSESL